MSEQLPKLSHFTHLVQPDTLVLYGVHHFHPWKAVDDEPWPSRKRHNHFRSHFPCNMIALAISNCGCTPQQRIFFSSNTGTIAAWLTELDHIVADLRTELRLSI